MSRLRVIAAALALATPGIAAAAGPIMVHRDPGCGCCGAWAAQVRARFSRTVSIVNDGDRGAFRAAHGVPANLVSCHTALIDGMVFEGHVPLADMARALSARPAGITGLAVAGMPVGSPGMEIAGSRRQPFDVIAFGPTGRRVFAHHA